MQDLRYPIGRFHYAGPQREEWLQDIAALPGELMAAVASLGAGQLDTAYRPDGWTVRQVVHHVADSHINSFCRFRFALTEAEPMIKPYDEEAWVKLPDGSLPPEVSLQLLSALHARWVAMLSGLPPEAWQRAFRHPESGRIPLDQALGLYSWHGRHHTAHITRLRERLNW